MLRKVLSLFKKPEPPVAIEPVIVPVVAELPPTVTEIKIFDTVDTPVEVKIVTKKVAKPVAAVVSKKQTSKIGRPKK